LQTFDFLITIPKVFRLISPPMTVPTGISAMRAVQSGSEKPNVRRKYLSPDEARRVIGASARVGRQGERDRLLLTLIYRHGLRVSEAVDLRWTDFDLDAPKARPFHVRRLKGSKDSVHTLEPDTARLLKRLQGDGDGPYESGRSAVAQCRWTRSR
jgi:integrase